MDKVPISFGLSVNGSHFAKCSALKQRAKSVRQALSQIYRQTVFRMHGKRLSCIRKKTDQICI